jgi:hypothetical protein
MDIGLQSKELTIKFNVLESEKITVMVERLNNNTEQPDFAVTISDKYGKVLANATSNWTRNRYDRNKK